MPTPRASSLFLAGSAGERFGTVMGARPAGEFLLRLSRYPAGLRMPLHHHPRPYFCFVVGGGMEERHDLREHHFEPGSVHFHPPGEPHAGRIGSGGMATLSIIAMGDMAERLSGKGATSSTLHHLGPRAARCYEAFGENDEASDLSLEAAALDLAAAFLRHRTGFPRSKRPAWLDDVRDHLHRHASRPVRLRELAGVGGVHEVHVVRAFRRYFGVTPGAYQRRLRILAARAALLETDRPLIDVALGAGFKSQAHFTRVFHRETGLPPAAFRRRHARRES